MDVLILCWQVLFFISVESCVLSNQFTVCSKLRPQTNGLSDHFLRTPGFQGSAQEVSIQTSSLVAWRGLRMVPSDSSAELAFLALATSMNFNAIQKLQNHLGW